MINTNNGNELVFNSTCAAGKQFNMYNYNFFKNMNKDGGEISSYHLLPGRVEDEDS